ncbi:MAG: hypothetical protein IPN77_33420 [Sandaracinaceae bacterium]|nr:hypothetical protein [Sandaracinaceae bacterium]
MCGIEVEGLEPWDDYTPDTAYAVDCARERLRALDGVAHTWSERRMTLRGSTVGFMMLLGLAGLQ